MSKVRGVVARIGAGQYSKYIMLVDRDGFYFNTKFNPKCGVGDEVGITYTPKGDTRGNITNIKILTDAGGPKGVQEEKATSGGGGGESGGARQDSIIWQHSQEMAILYVALLFTAGSIIKLPKGADAAEAVVATAVDDATARFFEDASAPRKSEAFKSAAEVDEDLSDASQAEKDAEWDDKEEEGPNDEWEN